MIIVENMENTEKEKYGHRECTNPKNITIKILKYFCLFIIIIIF